MKQITSRISWTLWIQSGFFLLLLSGFLLIPIPIDAAVLYKSYIVRHDRGKDILCDPYIVQKNDFVTKLFEQRGEISGKDFPRFLSIFRRLNPHIRNINRILPGQNILIPLKELNPDTLPGQTTGVVTIPFVTLSNVSDLLKTYSTTHKVKRGDSISRIVAREYGKYGSQQYRKGITLFKFLNPEIKNLNRIYLGQALSIPNLALQNQPWYKSLFDDSGNLRNTVELNDLMMTEENALETTGAPVKADLPMPAFSKVASFLGAKLLTKGNYFFPQQEGGDVELDLARFPIMEFQDRTRLLFPQGNTIQRSDLEVIKSYWHSLKTVSASRGDSLEKVLDAVLASLYGDKQREKLLFSDHGVVVEVRSRWVFSESSRSGKTEKQICLTPIIKPKERTPDSIVRYLARNNIIIREEIAYKKDTTQINLDKPISYASEDIIRIEDSDQKTFVADLLIALGYRYAQECQITFPYAGIQIRAESNLVSRDNGKLLLIDFGDFYGEAILALEKAGFGIVQINDRDNFHAISKKLFGALDVSFTSDPTFFAVERSGKYNTSLMVPGCFLPKTKTSKVLITTSSLHDDLIQFFREQDMAVIMIETKR